MDAVAEELIRNLPFGRDLKKSLLDILRQSGWLMGFASMAFIGRWVLRLVLHRSGDIPKDYTDFLSYATKVCLLRTVGNHYVFIHYMLLMYFAQTDLN